MKNPYFRANTIDGHKVDINLQQVAMFREATESTWITFANGDTVQITESAQTVRGRTRKAWPEQNEEA
jgi:hypothetical protein